MIIGSLFFIFPAPESLNPKGWHLLGIFIATIIGIVLKPLPMGGVALLSLLFSSCTGTIDIVKEGFSGYSSHIVWLIVYVFFIARAFIKTHLGARIAYFFVSLMGGHSIGLAYGILFTEVLVSPVIPSNGARAGGLIYPIVKSIAESLGSRSDDGTAAKIGSYLVQVSYHGNLVTSAMFLTAMAANPLVQGLVADMGIKITFLNWLWASWVPGLCSLFLIPPVLYYLDPPELKHLKGAKELAKQKLHSMGGMSHQEMIMATIFVTMLALWICGEQLLGIGATQVALLGLVSALLTNVLSWEDLLKEHDAWHTLLWFAILVSMAGFLQKFGVVDWFSHGVEGFVSGMEWHKAFAILTLVYFYSHYFFASNTAHVGAMYAAFLSVAISTGTPPLLGALVLGFCNSLFSSMTHYGSSSSVVLYGSGYVPIGKWWLSGFIISVMNVLVWGTIGVCWWKLIALW